MGLLETYFNITTEKKKTDIHLDGHWLFIANIESEICFLIVTRLHLLQVRTETSSQANYVKYGRLNSDKAEDGYVKYDLRQTFSVSRSLG